jgi:lysyl-tRNA synthetase class I
MADNAPLRPHEGIWTTQAEICAYCGRVIQARDRAYSRDKGVTFVCSLACDLKLNGVRVLA